MLSDDNWDNVCIHVAVTGGQVGGEGRGGRQGGPPRLLWLAGTYLLGVSWEVMCVCVSVCLCVCQCVRVRVHHLGAFSVWRPGLRVAAHRETR